MAKPPEKLSVQHEILKLPYLVLSVSILLTVGVTYLFYQGSQIRDAARFDSQTAEIQNRIELKVSAYIAMIKAGRGFVESNDKLSQEKFTAFVNNLELSENYRGVEGFGFCKKVLPGEREKFVKKMREGSFRAFKISPESERPEYQAVIYIEPQNESNSRMIGYDMSSEPVRREALDRARDTGFPAATAKVFLAEDKNEANKQTGFLIYLPVYKAGFSPATPEDRQRLLEGFVYSPFRADNFLHDAQNNISTNDIAVTLYEGERQPENILARSTGESELPNNYKGFIAADNLDVAGRHWLIEYQSLPSFDLQSSTAWTPLIFIGGVVFSLLLFGMTYLESFARVKAEQITRELQESESEKALLLDREQIQRRRAEEANKSKDEFISIVSHELRTPLNAIAGWSKILCADNLSLETKKQALQKIDRNLRIQTKIVEELLDFSQILSGKSDLSYQEIEISKIFEDACAYIDDLADEKRVAFVKENLLDGQRIRGDGERLQRAIKNLLANAVKFTPSGGKIFARVKEKDNMIELTIEDNGQGIKLDFLPHIFERFSQGDSSSTRRHGGLGLGLATARYIVKLHGGSIQATSEGEGTGAIFTVKLPLGKPRNSSFGIDRS